MAEAESTGFPLEAPGPAGPLRGTMMQPSASAPVVLMIPGSGPTDRDGNNPLGVRAAPLRLLAEALAQRGIASVRVDKRGMFGSAGAVADPNAVTIDDYAADVRSWIDAIRRRNAVACVWVLGHSEGGLVALRAGGKPQGICGLVLVATAGRKMGDVLRAQLRANPANAPILAQAEAAISSLEARKPVDTAGLHPALASLFRPRVQGFLIDMFALDPTTLIAGCRVPVLIVQGERDLQVGVEDARRLAQAQPAARLVLLPGVNHVLKTVAGDTRAGNVATYADPSLPLAPGIANAIANFIEADKRK